jgi:CHAT domain-containing protein
MAMSHPAYSGADDSDGLLTMGEIMWLHLNADWVVLSACNTASPDGRGKEAMSGLGQAFFYAGARSMLATDWPVETNSAKTLTTGLFRRLEQDPDVHRAQALQRSQTALIDGPGTGEYAYAHPNILGAVCVRGRRRRSLRRLGLGRTVWGRPDMGVPVQSLIGPSKPSSRD